MEEVENGYLIKILFKNDRLDNMLFEVSGNFIICNSLVMLGGDEDSVNMYWNHGTVIIVVLNCKLGFTIKP